MNTSSTALHYHTEKFVVSAKKEKKKKRSDGLNFTYWWTWGPPKAIWSSFTPNPLDSNRTWTSRWACRATLPPSTLGTLLPPVSNLQTMLTTSAGPNSSRNQCIHHRQCRVRNQFCMATNFMESSKSLGWTSTVIIKQWLQGSVFQYTKPAIEIQYLKVSITCTDAQNMFEMSFDELIIIITFISNNNQMFTTELRNVTPTYHSEYVQTHWQLLDWCWIGTYKGSTFLHWNKSCAKIPPFSAEATVLCLSVTLHQLSHSSPFLLGL